MIKMDNMRFYEKFKQVPNDAKKTITGGRLKGFTDINPMWRIKTLTDAFGPCGIGWNVKIVNERSIPGGSKGEVALFVDVELTFRQESGEWSEPVFGTGGSMLVANETGGLRLDDEAYKKAYTDAISVACKALGIGADVYWDKDSTKYQTTPTAEAQPETKKSSPSPESDDILSKIELEKSVIIKLGATKGLDESMTKLRAEAYIENKTAEFVEFDNMDLGQLAQVKLAINRLKSA